MSCIADVKQAILDKAIDEITTGRYTFKRISDDTIQLTNTDKSKATSNKQALAIANEVLKRTFDSFNGHVTGYTTQDNDYSPRKITFRVSNDYIKHEFDKMQIEEGNDLKENDLSLYGDVPEYFSYKSSLLGNDTLFAPNSITVPTQSPYAKLVTFKKQLISTLENKKSNIRIELKKDKTVAERKELLRQQSEIVERLEGNHKDKVGLYSEVKELETGANIKATSFYIEQDLDRLNVLSKSNLPYDIKEARAIVDFIQDAGTFQIGIENPFFTEQQIFKQSNGKSTDEIGLLPNDMQPYIDYATKASTYESRLNLADREAIETMINNNSTITNKYGVQNYEDITAKNTGIKDVDWVSLWLMDTSQNLGAGSSVIGQAIPMELNNRIAKKEGWVRDVWHRMDAMYDDVQKELSTINNGSEKLNGLGILGVKGVSFKIFMQKYKSGRETGKLINLFSEDYDNTIQLGLGKFFEDLKSAKSITDYATRQKKIGDIYHRLLNEKRKHTKIFDLTKIPEIANDKEFTQLSNNFVDDGGVHKAELIKLLGQKEYDKQVDLQKQNLKNYIAERENILEGLFATNGVTDYNSLPDKEKHNFQIRDASVNPFIGIQNYEGIDNIKINNQDIYHSGKYNTYVPREFRAVPSVVNGKLIFTDTNTNTGFYNEDFRIIQNNPTLLKFHELATEVLEGIRENLPAELQQQMAAGTVPSHIKSITEMLMDKQGTSSILQRLVAAFRQMIDNFRTSWGAVKEGNTSNAIIDRRTGKANYTVNTSFLRNNLGAINNKKKIEQIKFLQSFNANAAPNLKINTIKPTTIRSMNDMDENTIALLSEYLGADLNSADIRAKDFSKIKAMGINPTQIQIGKVINEYVTHNVVQSQSFDLPKLLKMYSNLTMAYAARQEALPLLEIVKKHYDDIKNPIINNQDVQKKNIFSRNPATNGLRNNAISQMSDYFNRVVLNNYNNDNSKRIFKNTTLYSKQEKEQIKELDTLIANETDAKKKIDLQQMKDAMGKILTSQSILDRILDYVRFLGLGYNIPSAIMNNIDGYVSNMIQASSNEFYDGKHIFYGMKVTRFSRLKSLSLGKVETGLAKKNSILMERYNILMDNKNEMQKSSVKTNFSALEKLNPYYINSSVEYINQSPVMIAMLKSKMIKDDQGNELSVWDAMDDDGKLHDEFRSDENIKNWEEQTGEDYLKFKNKIGEAIVKAHGNYDDLRGMKIKSNPLGKVIMMFKTWMTGQMFARFAQPQYNIKSESEQKGRMRSLTKASGGMYGAVMGTVTLGPIGLVLGAVAGVGAAAAFGTQASEISFFHQLLDNTKQLAQKMVSMPINAIAGKAVINTNKGYEKWVGGKFTTTDEKNMRANITEMALVLTSFLTYLILKKAFSGDDDKKKEHPFQAALGNVLINKVLSLISNTTTFSSPSSLHKQILGDAGIFKFMRDAGDVAVAMQKYMDGNDINTSGDFKGESNLWRHTKKLVLPSIMRDMSLGFKSSSDRIFADTPWANKFKSDKQKEKESIKTDRVLESDRLKEMGYGDKQIKHILNEEYPTQARLKKLEMTREEYEQQYGGNNYTLPEIEEEEPKDEPTTENVQ